MYYDGDCLPTIRGFSSWCFLMILKLPKPSLMFIFTVYSFFTSTFKVGSFVKDKSWQRQQHVRSLFYENKRAPWESGENPLRRSACFYPRKEDLRPIQKFASRTFLSGGKKEVRAPPMKQNPCIFPHPVRKLRSPFFEKKKGTSTLDFFSHHRLNPIHQPCGM